MARWGDSLLLLSAVATFSLLFFALTSSPNSLVSVSRSLSQQSQISWGKIFLSSFTSDGIFPKMGCTFAGKPICCSALDNSSKTIKSKAFHSQTCTVKKEYHPSPYELNHLEKAEELAKILDLNERTHSFISFIESPEEIDHAKRWLARVAYRLSAASSGVHTLIEETADDRDYLSRYKVTRSCGGGGGAGRADHSWWEYIEPLSVHARHPFGLAECDRPGSRKKIYGGHQGRTGLISVDYLLLQSAHDLMSPRERNSSASARRAAPSNVYLLDSGTSRFDSSLDWFVCAYEQVRLSSLCLFVSLCLSVCLCLSLSDSVSLSLSHSPSPAGLHL
jgi:hypothetical protein